MIATIDTRRVASGDRLAMLLKLHGYEQRQKAALFEAVAQASSRGFFASCCNRSTCVLLFYVDLADLGDVSLASWRYAESKVRSRVCSAKHPIAIWSGTHGRSAP